MKEIFEEYGKLILAVFVLIAVIAIIFGSSLFSDLGEQVDVDTTLINREEKVSEVFERSLPTIKAVDGKLKYFKNDEFKPLDAVVATDADGQAISKDSIKIVSIKFYNTSDNKTYIVNYDANSGSVNIAGFITDNITNKNIEFKGGTIIVNYRATDSHNVSVTKTLSFVVDNKNKV